MSKNSVGADIYNCNSNSNR